MTRPAISGLGRMGKLAMRSLVNNGINAEIVLPNPAAVPLNGILGHETRPLMSGDYVTGERSATIDRRSTMDVNGTLVKVFAWYDNEYGCTFRLADVTRPIVDSPE